MAASLFDGFVTLQLDGKTVELKPSPGAALKLCKLYGGLFNILPRLRQLDLEAAAHVVQLGAQLEADISEVQIAIYRTGILEVCPDLVEFVEILMNGGHSQKPQAKEEASGGEGKL